MLLLGEQVRYNLADEYDIDSHLLVRTKRARNNKLLSAYRPITNFH